jgi:hypothetical protein
MRAMLRPYRGKLIERDATKILSQSADFLKRPQALLPGKHK